MDEVAVKVTNVYKDFRLVHNKASTVKNLFTAPLTYLRKRNVETQHALKDISFEVKKGEFFGIVGRNGSGKSTLLKLLAGIYQPNQGTVKVNGKLVPFIELGVGFNPELTGRANVYLNGALLGFSEREVDQFYNEVVDFAELEEFMDKKLKNFSSGMQVRLAFSMAIRANADILLIDEVLAVGDADFQRKCFSYFKKLKRDKKTVIFVSHDMNAVREYCDRAIMIEASELVVEGPANHVASSYSRLFTEEHTVPNKPKEEEMKRWGDGAIRYGRTTVSPSSVKGHGPIMITLQAEAYEAVDSPIFGFSIKNEAGEYLLGTNTHIKQIKVKDLKKGDKIELKWTIPNIFVDGLYFVNPAVERSDGITECDWIEEAESFTVYKDEKTPYPIAPEISVEIS